MRLIALGFLLFGAAAASADVLWGNAKAGDSLAAVQAAHPEGSVVEPTPGKALKSGAVQRYAITGIGIAGEPFDAAFYFGSAGLVQVSLSHSRAADSRSCASTTNDIATALRSKYGAELSKESRPGDGFATHVFAMNRTSISLTMFSIGPSCNVFVAYNTRVSASADKL